MTAYYNEIDPYAAQWLRNLIDAGHIAPGVVDERSIEDVTPAELAGYPQCHFFAGIGVWSLALRSAGWPDDRPVWTGSCPCQPFSAAGKGAGFDDERHLWPAWQHLIDQCRPAVVFGEQVASKAVDLWIDLVHADMEGMGYAFGGIAFPSAGVGAPHIRDRTFWVADASSSGWIGRQGISQRRVNDGAHAGRLKSDNGFVGSNEAGLIRVGHSNSARLEGHAGDGGAEGRQGSGGPVAEAGVSSRMADANGRNASAEREQRGWEQRQQPQDGGAVRLADATISGRREERAHGGRFAFGDSSQGHAAGLEHGGMRGGLADTEQHHRRCEAAPADNVAPESNRPTDWTGGRSGSPMQRPGPTNGFWRDADWLGCTDGKWRPVEPGTFPLADGAASRVGRLRAYGNAINARAAQAFIQSYCEARELMLP